MKEGYVEVNTVPTHIFTWGQWIEDDFDEGTKEIVLMVTGNPGLGGFYTQFCSTIHDELDNKIPVWVIGHAGHDEPKKELKLVVPPLEGNKDLYDLAGQVKHKVEFIKKFIPKHIKIHLVAHSIGSKIAMELLKTEGIQNQIHQCYLLFPTIEKMIESKNGFWFYEIFNHIFFLLQYFYYAFFYLPLTVRTIILYMFCWLAGYPKFFLGTVIKTSIPSALDKIWFMTQDEMVKVRKLDEEVIKANINRIKFYYGTTDGWVPTMFYHELIRKFPGIDAELCTQKIDHGFVVSHGPQMARMVSEWIRRLGVPKSN